MNISIVINELDVRGGTHKQVLRLSEYCKKNLIQFEIVTKYYDSSSTYPEFAGFDIKSLFSVNSKSVANNSIWSKIKRRLHGVSLAKLVNMKSKIINFHDNGLGFGFLIIFYKLCGRTIIWQINDLPICFLEGNSKSIRNSVRHSLGRGWYRFVGKFFVDEFTVNATKNADRIYKHFRRSARIYHCGTDMLQAKQHSRIHNKCLNLLTCGIFLKYRNYETQLRVIKKLRDARIKCVLNIIGATNWDHEYFDSIQETVQQLGLHDCIRIHGQVDENRFIELHNEADIFIFINIDQSWGLSVFEAMSVGLPVIVSESVGAVEFLSNEIDAIVVDPLNADEIFAAIIRLASDPVYYSHISANAREKASNLSWDKTYSENMTNLFHEYSRR